MTDSYSKPFLTIHQQIALLQTRGLTIADPADAGNKLQEYGYYRLSGYSHPMRVYNLATGSHTDDFMAGSDIEHAFALIEFDRGLRSLFMSAAERIEIAVRVQVAILLGARSPWAHRDPSQFYEKFSKRVDPRTSKIPFNDWIARLDEQEATSKEQFASHFRQKYSEPPPIWVSIELWDFGMLSKLVGGLTVFDQKALGAKFGLARRELLPTWLRAINHVRNISAHHSRLWNRSPVDQPKPPRLGELAELDHLANDNFAQTRLYGVAAPIQFMLKQINREAANAWANQLKTHVATFPNIATVPFSQTGFPDGWQDRALWN